FPRRPGESPTRYPNACAPQAWASAAGFLLLQSCLGLRIDAPGRRLSFVRPILPPFLQRVELHNITIGDARVGIRLERHPDDVGLTVTQREGDVEILVVK
ncbi:MAG TPA: amylo-alpha-1,6-glucosidase, partial [Nitrospira sp.]|nr:amylo-alpha-1,6-glucosidase [Nitrospira sp.]